jgi:hypothetical protein
LGPGLEQFGGGRRGRFAGERGGTCFWGLGSVGPCDEGAKGQKPKQAESSEGEGGLLHVNPVMMSPESWLRRVWKIAWGPLKRSG